MLITNFTLRAIKKSCRRLHERRDFVIIQFLQKSKESGLTEDIIRPTADSFDAGDKIHAFRIAE